MIPIIGEVRETLTLFPQLEAAVSLPLELAENSSYSSLIPFYSALLLFLQWTCLYLH